MVTRTEWTIGPFRSDAIASSMLMFVVSVVLAGLEAARRQMLQAEHEPEEERRADDALVLEEVRHVVARRALGITTVTGFVGPEPLDAHW